MLIFPEGEKTFDSRRQQKLSYGSPLTDGQKAHLAVKPTYRNMRSSLIVLKLYSF